MNVRKKNGFTLVELLAVIVIIMLIAGIGTYAVIRYINSSKKHANEISINSVKETGISYVKENNDNILWVKDSEDSNIEFTCVSFNSLINYGYYDESLFRNDNFKGLKFIKINRDLGSLSILNGEISSEVDLLCGNYYIGVPTCANPTPIYNGTIQDLVDVAPEYDEFLFVSPEDGREANIYEIKLSFINTDDDSFIWDGTNHGNEITINCEIKKKKIDVKLGDIIDINEDNFDGDRLNINNDSLLLSKIIDSLNKGTSGLVDGHIISSVGSVSKNDKNNKLKIDNIVIVDEAGKEVVNNYDINYIDSEFNYIEKKKVEKPTDTICKSNLVYNGKEQTLAVAEVGYTLSNNFGIDAGSYDVVVKLEDDYKWKDGSLDDITITCSIGKANYNILLSDKVVNYSDGNFEFNAADVSVKGINNKVISTNDLDLTFSYYSSSSCSGNSIDLLMDVGTYYGKVLVGSIKNYKESSSNCAKLTITGKYTVSFNANGGENVPKPQTAVIGTSIIISEVIPDRKGYAFLGWSLDKEATEDSEGILNPGAEYKGTKDVVLYAVWGKCTLQNYKYCPVVRLCYQGSEYKESTAVYALFKNGQRTGNQGTLYVKNGVYLNDLKEVYLIGDVNEVNSQVVLDLNNFCDYDGLYSYFNSTSSCDWYSPIGFELVSGISKSIPAYVGYMKSDCIASYGNCGGCSAGGTTASNAVSTAINGGKKCYQCAVVGAVWYQWGYPSVMSATKYCSVVSNASCE